MKEILNVVENSFSPCVWWPTFLSHATEGVVWNSYFDLVPSRALTIVKHCRVDSMCLRHKALYCGPARRFICGSCRIGPLQHGCEHLVTFPAL